MSNLRRDLGDTEPPSYPTIGGRWVERGFLTDEHAQMEPNNRSLASNSTRSLRGQGSSQQEWISLEQQETNRRDFHRNMPTHLEVDPANPVISFSNTPDLTPSTRRLYKNGFRATRADFLDDSPNEGSLWASDGQTNYFFTKNKVRGIGDVVTVNFEEALIRDVAQEVRRTLSPHEKTVELALAQERIRAKALGLDSKAIAGAESGKTTQNDKENSETKKVEDIQTPEATPADVDVVPSLGVKVGDTFMAEIVERYSNGNYKIRGTKKVPYKNGTTRLVSMIAAVRNTDISEEDIVNSGKLYEYKLEAIR